MKVLFCVGINTGNMIQVSGEATLPQAGCVCSTLASRAQVKRSTHKGNCSLERSQHAHLFFVSQEGEVKTSALERLSGDRRRASPPPLRGVIFCICNQRSRRNRGLQTAGLSLKPQPLRHRIKRWEPRT